MNQPSPPAPIIPPNGPNAPQVRPPNQPNPPAPQLERWNRIQTQRAAGIVAICAGGILALLGLVRIAFSRLERTYATDMEPGVAKN